VLSFFCPLNICAAQKSGIPESIKKMLPNDAKLIFQNFSVVGCGEGKLNVVLTFTEVQALLVISNSISKNVIQTSTNWKKYHPDFFTISDMQENVPDDVKRVLLFCLSWDESDKSRQLNTNDLLVKLKQDKPWNKLDKPIADKINDFSDELLKNLINVVLNADDIVDLQGKLEVNSMLRTIPFTWLIDE